MILRAAAFCLTLLLPSLAIAQSADRPGPASPCINSVYDSMGGTWGVDGPDFRPNYIPVDAWQIFRNDAEIIVHMVRSEPNLWFLTEHGADYVLRIPGGYEGVYHATQLISCQEMTVDRPGVVESMISVGAPPNWSTQRERIEVTRDTLTITRWSEAGAVVSEDRMRRHQPPPAPLPPPPPPERRR